MDLMLNNQITTFLLSDHPIALLAQTGTRAVQDAPQKSTNWILGALFTLVVTAIAFYLLSVVFPFIEIDSPVTAIVCAVVFGAINIFAQRAEDLFNMTWILAPIALVINMAAFWITDVAIGGFRITNGIVGILIGSVSLTILQYLIRYIIGVIF
jgi:uncharacterized membrane protein YvlD (DUF360 family)